MLYLPTVVAWARFLLYPGVMPIKIKAGYLVLITAHDEDIRQDFVTWQQTVWA
jgi:hypothetical protein